MSRAMVAIVGRPNVGKSTLFNRILKRRISIVEDIPGVTRDRIYGNAEWLNRKFILVDTGGLDPDPKDVIFSKVKLQVEAAIEAADLILFVVDAREGLVPEDEEIANMLRKTKKEVILVCNKVDSFKEMPASFYDFFKLGLGEPIPISASNGLGIGELLDEVIKRLPENDVEYEEETIKIAVIGRPNVGKSSLVNRILGEERVIVSDIPGTTRDAIDTPFTKDGRNYILIDTAGIRRKSRISESIERYSVLRALAAIERADICLLMIDATEGPTEQDTKIAGYAFENGKGIIILVNKWDIVEKDSNTYKEYTEMIREKLAFISFAPILFISAKTGQRIHKVLETVYKVWEEYNKRITTGLLNNVLNEAMLMFPPPSSKGRPVKIYYATQVGTKPPTFVIFVNEPELLHFSYVRFLENTIRQNFGFEGVPIVISTKKRGED
ncbi:ribosome biogenesis GTPase Der [Caldanaerobacter subterraneus]|uniref:ribosome biogenesis GTPase Der n=1 Tax=Caldanaerobacter subterraneus TaxID=911092 RepID=UPI003463D33A